MFYEEKSLEAFKDDLKKLSVPDQISNPVKPYCVAAGAFLEFLIFLEYIKNPELNIASIAALLSIFGKALPYFPPGLFFTLAAHLPLMETKLETKLENRLESKCESKSSKKSRQLRIAGFMLITAGVVLNIGVIFFVIRNVGF